MQCGVRTTMRFMCERFFPWVFTFGAIFILTTEDEACDYYYYNWSSRSNLLSSGPIAAFLTTALIFWPVSCFTCPTLAAVLILSWKHFCLCFWQRLPETKVSKTKPSQDMIVRQWELLELKRRFYKYIIALPEATEVLQLLSQMLFLYCFALESKELMLVQLGSLSVIIEYL